MANDTAMKNSFKIYEDHPVHRKAKIEKLKHKPKARSDPEQPSVVTCPECGVTFDLNYSTKDGDHER